MKMEYKLLPKFKKGLLMTRQPEIVKDELIITFTGAPDGATAIFERKTDKTAIYRLLRDKTCSVPTDFLSGEITVRVSVLDGKTSAPVYVCEEIKATDNEAGTLLCPNDNNLPVTIVEIQLGMQTIAENVEELMTKYLELNKKFEKLLEGYDIT